MASTDEKQNSQVWAASLLGKNSELAVIDAVAELNSDETITEMAEQSLVDKALDKDGRFNLEIDIAGDIFERIALKCLEKEGDPANPALSDFLIDVARHPHKFLRKIKTVLENNMDITKNTSLEPEDRDKIQEVIWRIEDNLQQIREMPRNSDAIAFQTVGTEVTITGAFEMKGYSDFTNLDRLDAIGKQLKQSKQEAIEIFKIIKPYMNIYKELCATPTEKQFLPDKISIVHEDDFEQILIVPRNARGVENEEELNATLSVLQRSGCSEIRNIDITTRQIGNITKEIMPRIRDKIKDLTAK